MNNDPTIRLFNKSVLKQQKLAHLLRALGPVDGLHCLDVGADNGVISLLLRREGGIWQSADLEAGTVAAIRQMVGDPVYQIDGGRTPFEQETFDRVVIIDFLEHIPHDRDFVEELSRILKPGGKLVVNVPLARAGLLRRLRYALGQTDEKHGHLRPGYTKDSLRDLLAGCFEIEGARTYSGFFTELVDTLIVFAVGKLGKKKDASKKGLVITGQDLQANHKLFRMYSLIYPLFWLVSKLDRLFFWQAGYMLIARARRVA